MIADSMQLPAPLPAASRLEGAQLSPMTSKMHRPSPTDVMFRKKEQKDAELDKKIEALRKKNEALMKRYQEVEEDKKRAEQEGMAMQSRKGKAEDLTITINKSTNEARVVTKKPGSGEPPSPRGSQEPSEADANPFSMGRGKRRQLLVTMTGNTKGKRIVSEKRGQTYPHSPGGLRDLTEEEEDVQYVRRGRHHQPSKADARSQEEEGKQELQSVAEESQWLAECDPYHQDAEGSVPQSHTDLTVPTSKEEQLEYLRWKKEREQIDRERVARHKNAKGQWRRAWDMDKSENMFGERFHGESERGNQSRGGRGHPRRGHPRPATESRGHPQQNRDKGGKNLPAVSSKAKGKDRLTGRARRWDAKEEEEHLQTLETSFEEFLEELDAFGDPEVDSSTPGAESKEANIGKDSPPDMGAAGPQEAVSSGGSEGAGDVPTDAARSERQESPAADAASGTPATSQGDRAPKPRRASEKKVRFSEEAIKETKADEESPSPLPSEPQPKAAEAGKGASCCGDEEARPAPELDLRAPEEGDSQKEDQGVSDPPHSNAPLSGVPAECQAEGQGLVEAPKTETDENKPSNMHGLTPNPETDHRTMDANSAAPSEEDHDQPLKHSKNIATRTPEEMIDSTLSALSLGSGDPHPYHKTSTDKVKENGKIV
ncbi:coiled-coil domain-containing protein 9B [Megalops cyprinoides]|uniref:coiled-coil domain-containing protein 9B n=1 Tax=Megalops cyprinoides TaxID=118141 RepID=UPI0018653AD8|nr:coiled-coil domain-containing protein 9B [Megalops cyprinoides]